MMHVSYKHVVPNGLFTFRFAVRLLPGTRLQLPTDEHQFDSRLRHVTEMWFDARSQDFAGGELDSARRSNSVQGCPSITGSRSAGECLPAGTFGRVRSGR